MSLVGRQAMRAEGGVAAASAASQVTGASVSGVFAYVKRGGVDFQMGSVMVAGGFIGTLFGAALFRLLQQLGWEIFPSRLRDR